MSDASVSSAVGRFFQSVGWVVEGPDEQGGFSGSARGQHGTYPCTVSVDEGLGLVSFYVHSPSNVPPERLAEAAEFLTRANHRMRIGNFEMDFDDGEVRFKSQAIGDGAGLTPERVQVVVHSGLAAMDRYYPGLLETVTGAANAAQAIKRIEG